VILSSRHAEGAKCRPEHRPASVQDIQHNPKKTKKSQKEPGKGNLRGQRKAAKPAFILLTREIPSGLKWVEVD
jgi:hypothetical protein